MIDISSIDYSAFDRPEILNFLFYPHKEGAGTAPGGRVKELLIPVEKNIVIGARFYTVSETAPVILFFHGNGEIVADYSDLAPEYMRIGVNFLPVDYRGYGLSTGRPTITAMMKDCHVIFDFVKKYLHENRFTGPLVIMGRSLGSASALEIAYHYQEEIDALVIESGFAYIIPLLSLLGVDAAQIGVTEEMGMRNHDKIKGFKKPVLIIHAERDHIIPFREGKALYHACGSGEKKLLEIKGANHNNIFLYGHTEYMQAVKELVDRLWSR